MKAIASIGCAGLMAGCATPVGSVSMASPALAGTRTFAIASSDEPSGRALAPLVAERLMQFGFEPSTSPDLVVTVTATERPRGVGAFAPSGCGASAWTAEPRKPWLIGGGKVETITVTMTDPKSGETIYRTSAGIRSSSGRLGTHASDLVSTALAVDPRRTEVTRKQC